MVSEEQLQEEAKTWVMFLYSGEATISDAMALKAWLQASAAHERAFAKASLLVRQMAEAAVSLPALHSGHTVRSLTSAQRSLSRRAFLGAGIATGAAAAAAYAVFSPPMELWPSASELLADVRTSKGEQRMLSSLPDVSIMLNTRTSVNLSTLQTKRGIEIVAGEAAVATLAPLPFPFAVKTRQGTLSLRDANINIRTHGATVSISCLRGAADLLFATALTLMEGQAITIAGRAAGALQSVNTRAVTSWRNGRLVLEGARLDLAIQEINRYRSGYIALMRSQLKSRRVDIDLPIARIDDVIPFLQKAYDLNAAALPGGIVILS